MPCPLSDIFDMRYGHSLELNALEISNSKDGVAFVGRQTGGNGISAYVSPIPDLDPSPAGDISCALGGNGVLTTFVQEAPFYCGRDVAILRPKAKLTKQQTLFYCLCIKSNRFRFNYGRQANKTLNHLLIPTLNEIPAWVSSFDLDQAKGTEAPLSEAPLPPLAPAKWKEFRYDEIFDIRKGYYNKKLPECVPSPEAIPFIGASESNNGVTSYHRIEDIAAYARNGELEPAPTTEKKLFPANGITVANNGASVGYAFFQPRPFTGSHDVNPLYLLIREMTPEIGMFLCSVIAMDRYRWSYGRKWRPSRMPQSIIRLPAHPDGEPDWEFMETYVRSLPFSKTILAQQ
ncbi:S-CspCI protein [Beijerinckiaceae bacterium]|nr:S-CspCI protein [Beijerinckiaceae bacterium]